MSIGDNRKQGVSKTDKDTAHKLYRDHQIKENPARLLSTADGKQSRNDRERKRGMGRLSRVGGRPVRTRTDLTGSATMVNRFLHSPTCSKLREISSES